jgi:opacity protein-like surface antigen
MKNTIISIILFILLCPLAHSKSMNFGFTVGLALPNDNVSQFFNQAKNISVDSAIGDYLLDKATSMGYILGIKGRIELAEHFDLALGIGMARFNQGRYNIVDPTGGAGGVLKDSVIAQIQSTSNVVPIAVGINAYLMKSLISLYAVGDVTYNYVSYSYDILLSDKVGIPISKSENDSRLGYGLGVGLDLDISLFKINFEAKFNSTNIIGRTGDEQQKNYGTLTLGIIF